MYLEKLEDYIALGPSYNLPNNYMAFVLITSTQNKRKYKARSI